MKKKQDKQSYPLIKRLFGRKKPRAEGVYAGPDYYRKDPAPMEDVYAGPETDEVPEVEMEDVYAGPEYYERDPEEERRSRKRPIRPKDMNIDPPKPPEPPIKCVYAGPEYWDPSLRREPVPAPVEDPDTIPEELDDEPSRLRTIEDEPDLGDEA